MESIIQFLRSPEGLLISLEEVITASVTCFYWTKDCRLGHLYYNQVSQMEISCCPCWSPASRMKQLRAKAANDLGGLQTEL